MCTKLHKLTRVKKRMSTHRGPRLLHSHAWSHRACMLCCIVCSRDARMCPNVIRTRCLISIIHLPSTQSNVFVNNWYPHPHKSRFPPTMTCPCCQRLHSQRDLIIDRSWTKNHIERIKHPAYDFNNVMMIAKWNADGKPAGERWPEMFAHFRSREIP